MLAPKRRPKSPFWILRGTIDGKRVEISRGWKTAAEARRALPDILAERAPAPVGKAELTFRQAVKNYRLAKPEARYLDRLEEHFGDWLVRNMTNAGMRTAAATLYPDAAPATVRRQFYTPIKAVINMAAKDDLCAAPRLVSPTGGKKRTVFFTPEQADALVMAIAADANDYLAPMLTFMFGQGCRMREALTLDGRDVFLGLRMAILRDTKNGEERQVTLIPRVIAALSTLPTIGQEGAVFRRVDGLPFRSDGNAGGQIRQPFTRAVTAIGMDPARYTPHVCRHSWATWFHAQTRDVLRLQYEGGWKSGEWQRYTKMGTPELGEEARRRRWSFDLSGENRGMDRDPPAKATG